MMKTSALLVLAAASYANAATVGLIGHPSTVAWSNDQISEASITDSILHMASLPIQSLTDSLPAINVVKRPASVAVVLVDGPYSGNLHFQSRGDTAWANADLFDAMTEIRHPMEMSWSQEGILEQKSGQEWAVVQPSANLNDATVSVAHEGASSRITHGSDSMIVPDDVFGWQRSFVSEITHLSMPSTSRLAVFTVSSLQECEAEHGACETASRIMDAAIAQHASETSVVLVVSNMEAPARRLAGSPTLAPTAAVNQGNYTITEIVQYQINLWASIALVLVLLSAICCMVNMDIQPDSLLYAKFQADVSSKMD